MLAGLVVERVWSRVLCKNNTKPKRKLSDLPPVCPWLRTTPSLASHGPGQCDTIDRLGCSFVPCSQSCRDHGALDRARYTIFGSAASPPLRDKGTKRQRLSALPIYWCWLR